MALTGVQNAAFIKSILSDKFFSEICKFSALQRRKSDDMCTLLQSMMLLDNRYYDYEYTSLSANEVMNYAAYIKNNYSDEQKERLYDIIDYLEKAFPEQEKMLKKINIPMIILAANIAMGKDYNATKNIYRVGAMYFRQWFSYFFNECYEEYKQYCSSGSTKKEKTLKRIEVMETSLIDYFELQEPSSLEQQEESILPEDNASEDINSVDTIEERETPPVSDAISEEDDNPSLLEEKPPEESSMDNEEIS